MSAQSSTHAHRFDHTDPRCEFALDVVKQLRSHGFQALWAGGCVRDQLLGKQPKDYDVATNAVPAEVIRVFGEHRTIPVGAAFGVVMIPGPSKRHGQVEVATFRSDGQYLDGRRPDSIRFCSPREDAQRRDFTINGMFFDPIENNILDFVDGQTDLNQKIIRAIGNPLERFNEDRLRMLRAVRFTAALGFSLDPATLQAIQTQHHRIHSVSVERIFQELRRMLSHPSRATALQLLATSQLLPEVLPELAPILQSPEILSHHIRILQLLESVHFEPALALLLQPLQTPNAKPAQELGRRLKMSNQEINDVAWILDSLPIFRQIASKPLHILKPLVAHKLAPLLLAAATAEDLANNRPANDSDFAWHYLAHTPPQQLSPDPLLNGDDLIKAGIKPGPAMREILNAVRDEQLDEHISLPAEALHLALRIAQKKHTSSTS
jgi:tRNA nucleotidyltransferase/poly(A) polymerase